MSHPHDIDVFVAGLGPAGACAAAAAARGGLSVLAIERKSEAGLPVQCAEFVPATVGMDVPELSKAVQQPIRSMITYVETDDGDLTENFPGQMICRASLDAQLAEQAALAGAECQYGLAVQSVGEAGEILLSDGRHLRPRLIVGADGPHSLTARAIGCENAFVVETRQATVDLLNSHKATDIFLSAGIPGGYGWLFPKGNKANVGLGVTPEYKKQLKPLLDDLLNRLRGEGRIGETIHGYTGGTIPVGGMVKPFGTLGDTTVILAGDAAGLTNPVTGAGINPAIQSGKLAGEAAAGWLYGDTGALEDYEDELTALFGSSINRALKRRSDLIARYGDNRGPDAQDLRNGWIAYSQYWAA